MDSPRIIYTENGKNIDLTSGVNILQLWYSLLPEPTSFETNPIQFYNVDSFQKLNFFRRRHFMSNWSLLCIFCKLFMLISGQLLFLKSCRFHYYVQGEFSLFGGSKGHSIPTNIVSKHDIYFKEDVEGTPVSFCSSSGLLLAEVNLVRLFFTCSSFVVN